jgi:hypothetical protein
MGSELTIPLDADVAKQLEEARRAGREVDDAVNEAANQTVQVKDHTPVAPQPFVVRSANLGVPRINLDCISRALEEIEGPEWK